MIDSIKIILKNFSGNFDNCRLRPSRKVFKHPDEKEYENYLLPNHTRFDRHSMKVHRALKTGTVNVVGSLRKRAYHKSTLLDLNKDKFVQSLRGLAKRPKYPFCGIDTSSFYRLRDRSEYKYPISRKRSPLYDRCLFQA